MRLVDLFSGIGGFHEAMARVDPSTRCVLACDACATARDVYERRFGVRPCDDVHTLRALPPHDVLCAGFPCQSFSAIGAMRGLHDAERGPLVWETLRLARTARPSCILLENVRGLTTLDGGAALQSILDELRRMGYSPLAKVLNALDYGLPQRRERVFIVAFASSDAAARFRWPSPRPRVPLAAVLESDVAPRYFASQRVQDMTFARRGPAAGDPANRVWITDKGNRVTHRPYALTLRADPSHNSFLVDGKRRFTEREMLRLQGFPEDYDLPGLSYTAARSLIGNSVPINVVVAILESVVAALS